MAVGSRFLAARARPSIRPRNQWHDIHVTCVAPTCRGPMVRAFNRGPETRTGMTPTCCPTWTGSTASCAKLRRLTSPGLTGALASVSASWLSRAYGTHYHYREQWRPTLREEDVIVSRPGSSVHVRQVPRDELAELGVLRARVDRLERLLAVHVTT